MHGKKLSPSADPRYYPYSKLTGLILLIHRFHPVIHFLQRRRSGVLAVKKRSVFIPERTRFGPDIGISLHQLYS